MSSNDRNMHTPIQNPYIAGIPIKNDKLFFGRTKEFDEIRVKVSTSKKGGLLVICGTRRSGKTSMLFQILNGRLGEEYFPVLIDMQQVRGDSEAVFFDRLAQEIVDSVGSTTVSIQEDYYNHMDKGVLYSFQHLGEVLVRNLPEKRLLLLFDEYEIFEELIHKEVIRTDVFRVFSHWIDYEEGVFIIFAGSEKIENRNREIWKYLLDKAYSHIRIHYLDRMDAMRLIVDPVKSKVRYQGGVAEGIFKLTAGQPFYTQILCQIIIDRLNEMRTCEVTSSHVQYAVERIINNPLPHMNFSWEGLTNIEKLVLATIGEIVNGGDQQSIRARDITNYLSANKTGVTLGRAHLQEALETLFHKEYLTKDISTNSYAFKMQLYQKWIVHMHSLWKVIHEVRTGGHPGAGIGMSRGKKTRYAIYASLLLVIIAAIFTRTRQWENGNYHAGVPDSVLANIYTVPSAALVRWGNYIDYTPIEDVMMQKHNGPVLLRKDGFRDTSIAVSHIKEGGELDTTIVMTRITGSLRIISQPDGAAILLNDSLLQLRTPATIQNLWVLGKYRLTLEHEGYELYTISLPRIDEDTTKIVLAELIPFRKRMWFSSSPESADIFIDNEYIGNTPVQYGVVYGSHSVKLSKQGYKSRSDRIDVSQYSGDVYERLLREEDHGYIVVRIFGTYADVFIDDVLYCRQTYNCPGIDVKTGIHKIRAVPIRHEQQEKTVTIAPRDTIYCDFEFK